MDDVARSIQAIMRNLLLVSAAVLSVCQSAEAIDIPRNVEAGVIEQQLKASLKATKSGIAEKQYAPLSTLQGAEKIAFVLKSVGIDGVKKYQLSEFEPFYAAMIGTQVTLADIYEVADKIRRIYHEDGFVLTQVFLPEQDISDGNVRIRVTEGFISSIRWKGQVAPHDIVSAMAEHIRKARPFNSKVLEDAILRINGLPGMQAQVALEPLPRDDAEEGAVGLVITLERKRYDASVSVDNYASRYLDVWQSTADASFNGVFADLDRVSYVGLTSADPARLRFSSFQYTIPVHETGTSLNVGWSWSFTHPGFQLAPLDIYSRAQNLTLGLTQPVFRSRLDSLDISAQFALKRQVTEVFEQDFSEDRLRTVTVNALYNLSDNLGGVNLVDIGLSRGLDIMNPTTTKSAALSRADGRHDFTKLLVNASRLQAISDNLSLLISTSVQETSASLLSAEQFGVGGSIFGRGYDSSEISGDEGIAFSAELRWDVVDDDIKIQPFIFYDIGEVHDKNHFTESVSLASTGLGARMQWKSLRIDTSIAQPLTYTPATPKLGSEQKDLRYLINIGLAI
jgi:hemolysin activation/secretion protein